MLTYAGGGGWAHTPCRGLGPYTLQSPLQTALCNTSYSKTCLVSDRTMKEQQNTNEVITLLSPPVRKIPVLDRQQ